MFPARLGRVVLRLAYDGRGVATLEGIVVLALFAGVFFACLLLGQWGVSLQSGQMGARLLAFDAGDAQLARLGRVSRHPAQSYVNEDWVMLFNSRTANWINRVFTLSNGRFLGSVADTTHGRLPGGPSLFGYAPASMRYHTDQWSAATGAWPAPDSALRLKLLSTAYYVGRYRLGPDDLDSTYGLGIPAAIPILETIYARVGVR